MFIHTFESGRTIEVSADEESGTILIQDRDGIPVSYTARHIDGYVYQVVVSPDPIPFELLGGDWNELHLRGRGDNRA